MAGGRARAEHVEERPLTLPIGGTRSFWLCVIAVIRQRGIYFRGRLVIRSRRLSLRGRRWRFQVLLTHERALRRRRHLIRGGRVGLCDGGGEELFSCDACLTRRDTRRDYDHARGHSRTWNAGKFPICYPRCLLIRALLRYCSTGRTDAHSSAPFNMFGRPEPTVFGKLSQADRRFLISRICSVSARGEAVHPCDVGKILCRTSVWDPKHSRNLLFRQLVSRCIESGSWRRLLFFCGPRNTADVSPVAISSEKRDPEIGCGIPGDS